MSQLFPMANRLFVNIVGLLFTAIALLVILLWPSASSAKLPGQSVYVVTSTNTLLQFNSTNPGAILTQQVISGLQAGEAIVGIDFRPATGQLYGLGSTSRLYVIKTQTGVASLVGAGPFTPSLSGTAFGFDFNPVPDRIRVTSEADQNMRLNPNTGALSGIDSTLVYSSTDVNAGQNPAIVGAAYTNNISGTTSTTLYVIDSNLDILARQGGPGSVPSPNGGQLSTIGALGTDVVDMLGFDISPQGTAYVAYSGAGGGSTFGTIDLATGTITPIGLIGGGATIRGLAIPAGQIQYGVFLPIVGRD